MCLDTQAYQLSQLPLRCWCDWWHHKPHHILASLCSPHARPRPPQRSIRPPPGLIFYLNVEEHHWEGPTNHIGRDAGAAKEWSHLLLVNTRPALLSAKGIDVHQEAPRPVGCKVKEGFEIVIKKTQCLPSFFFFSSNVWLTAAWWSFH